jgi:hypothetical protein
MNDDDARGHRPDSMDCPRTRVAQNSVGAVDVCDCGMWQVHLGAVTLRFAPCGLSELLALLGSAVAERAARRSSPLEAPDQAAGLGLAFGPKRGEA